MVCVLAADFNKRLHKVLKHAFLYDCTGSIDNGDQRCNLGDRPVLEHQLCSALDLSLLGLCNGLRAKKGVMSMWR
jgi:hypothetical protein